MATFQPGQAGVATNRSIAGVGTTSTSPLITGPTGSFQPGDAGRLVTGAGIPALATILSVESSTAATLSANATATATIVATVGGGDGVMVVAGQPNIKTNDKAVTGVGTEGPGAIPGGTIADGKVRGTVDTRNATNVGTPGDADVEAPRVWT